MIWAYGVTTVPQRKNDLLPRTLASLSAAGFPEPHLFIDGDNDSLSWYKQFNCKHITIHYPNIHTHGNWVLAAYELFIKNPKADRYAIFQDDLVTYKNLRAYLDVCEYPPEGYCNLLTFPQNQRRFDRIGRTNRFQLGWKMSNQRGLGAVALVFNQPTLLMLLSHRHLLERPLSEVRGKGNVDGGIVDTMVKQTWREYVHNPSLVQHIGDKSSMRHGPFPKAVSFRGEHYDAANLAKEVEEIGNK